MTPKLVEPTNVDEAREYVGTEIWKFFPSYNQTFHGKVADIDTLVENESGIEEEGLFYRVDYDDGDSEHLVWKDLAMLMLSNKAAHALSGSRRQRSADSHSGVNSAAASVQKRASAGKAAPSSKRRRSSGRQQQQDAAEDSGKENTQDQEEELPDAADEDYEAPATTKAGSKRSRAKQQVPDSSARNNARKQQMQRAAASSPAGPAEPDNDAAAAPMDEDHPADEAAAAARQQDEEDEELQAADPDAMERILREGNNEVVTVRQQGLAGHIKSVQVQNFMCHQNFAIDLGTHVNVISGTNGSGKSAVLQAIQNCLGVKAKDTGRGDSMKDFVRKGCHDCKIQVTIWNTGEDAYKHHEYGDWITVERSIKITGAKETASSKIRLLSSHGRVVSQKADELKAMMDHLNIDAGNPLAVMTQDTSRNFLCGSVADKKKYNLFMEATMLADMQLNLRKAQAYVNEMKEIMKSIAEDHKGRWNRVREVREKLKKLLESEGLTQQRTMFERAVCWSAVEEVQQRLEALKQQLEVDNPKKRAEVVDLLEAVDRELDLLRQQLDALVAEDERNQQTQQSFTSQLGEMTEDIRRKAAERRRKQQVYSRERQKLEQAKEELKGLMESTRETNDDRRREYEQKLQEHNQKVAEATQQMQAAEAEYQQYDQQLQQLTAQQQQKEQELRNLQDTQRGVQGELNRFQADLHQLQAAKGQKQAMFGQGHAMLRTLVDRNRRSFAKVPIGPLGMHLTLTNQMWDVAAEVVLGRHLDSWMVHSSKDEQMLRKLAFNAKVRVNIIVANFDRPAYNLAGRQGMAPGWQSLRQFVQVEHPQYPHIIDNKLMDLTHYENVVVDDNEARCRTVVYDHAAGPAVSQAVHVSGKSWVRVRRVVSAGNYYADRRPRLSHSYEASLQTVNQLIAAKQAEYQNLQQQLVVVNRDLQQLKRDAAEVLRLSRQVTTKRLKAQHAIQGLQAHMPVLDPIDDESVDGMLAEQQRTLQEQIATLQIAHDKAKHELDEAQLRHEQAKQLLQERQQEVDEMMSQMDSNTEEVNRLEEKIKKDQSTKDRATARLQQLDQDMAKVQKIVDSTAQDLEQLRAQALQTCNEEDGMQAMVNARATLRRGLEEKMQRKVEAQRQAGRTITEELAKQSVEAAYQDLCYKRAAATFAKNVKDVEAKIKDVESSAGGSREELEHQLNLAEREYNRHQNSYQNCKKVFDMASAAVNKRWEMYYGLHDTVTSTVSKKFMAYMHRRGHQGQVRVDSDAKELRLLVKINSQAAGQEAAKKMRAVTDLKQLSGGERSFTTVAFILALGHFTESPFRAMDEFDVFMDAINRRIATQTLLQFAREKGHLQFILLTPQDLQAVEDAKRKLSEGPNGKALPEGFVKVVQMRPARPNQQ